MIKAVFLSIGSTVIGFGCSFRAIRFSLSKTRPTFITISATHSHTQATVRTIAGIGVNIRSVFATTASVVAKTQRVVEQSAGTFKKVEATVVR
jgi:hypothetical protein